MIYRPDKQFVIVFKNKNYEFGDNINYIWNFNLACTSKFLFWW